MNPSNFALSLLLLLGACGGAENAPRLGELSLALSTQTGGQTYHLSEAEFTLLGPVEQQFAAEGDDPIVLTLPIGSYTLALKEGWVMTQLGDAGMMPIAAKLVSENPAALVIGPGVTTQAILRFALSNGTAVEMATGTLQIGVAVGDGPSDASVPGQDSCSHGLVVNEIDYEQTGADDAEFVEVLNTASCAARLVDVSLELVNGGDGKVYGRSTLAAAGEWLPPGARLVVAGAKVLATLPAEVLRMPLGSGGLQNGAPDAVRLMENGVLLDGFSYEGQVNGAAEGTAAAADEGEGAFSRCPDGFDRGDNATDFRLVPATPGASNACS